MKKIISEIGVVVEYNGKYWGIEYEDGQVSSYDWVDIEKAKIFNPKYCKHPTDITYENSPDIKKLVNGKLVKILKTTIFETEE